MKFKPIQIAKATFIIGEEGRVVNEKIIESTEISSSIDGTLVKVITDFGRLNYNLETGKYFIVRYYFIGVVKCHFCNICWYFLLH